MSLFNLATCHGTSHLVTFFGQGMVGELRNAVLFKMRGRGLFFFFPFFPPFFAPSLLFRPSLFPVFSSFLSASPHVLLSPLLQSCTHSCLPHMPFDTHRTPPYFRPCPFCFFPSCFLPALGKQGPFFISLLWLETPRGDPLWRGSWGSILGAHLS